MWLVISTVFSKINDLPGLYTVIYIVKCGSISQTMQDEVIVTTDQYEVAYQTATILVTLGDFEGHMPTESLAKCDFFAQSCSS